MQTNGARTCLLLLSLALLAKPSSSRPLDITQEASTRAMTLLTPTERPIRDSGCSVEAIRGFYRTHLSDLRAQLSGVFASFDGMGAELNQLRGLIELQRSDCPELMEELRLIEDSIGDLMSSLSRAKSS